MKHLFFFFILFFTATRGYSQSPSARLPNIIYIYADDLGYGTLGSYGQDKIKTPHLDRMAKEGIRFTQHYAGAPVCAPSRAILMTGKHAGHADIRGNFEFGGFADSLEKGQMPLPENAITVAELLKKKNYRTAMVGKWGMGMTHSEGSPLRQGFDYFYGFLDQKQAHNHYPSHLWENEKWDTLDQDFINVHRRLDSSNATDDDFKSFTGKEYASEAITKKAMAFMERSGKNPFFLYLAYPLPHASLQVPQAYIEKYAGRFSESPYYGQRGYASAKHPLSTYAGMISYLDDQVGLILDKLKALEIDSNTIVFFSSDNGASPEGGAATEFFNCNGGLRGMKRDLYEGGIRVPLLVRWPGKIRAGTVSDLVCTQYDFFATVAELTGQQGSQKDGLSFLAEVRGNRSIQKKHPYVYFEFAEKGGQVAIRRGQWKAVKSNLKKDPHSQWELYDLANDRKETNNVAGIHPELLRKFDAILKREHQRPAVREWDIFSEPVAGF